MTELSRIAIIAGCISVIAPLGAARAQDDPRVAQARVRFEQGIRLYEEESDYALALREFQAAYDLMEQAQHPNAGLILFNIARCYWRLSRTREAIAAYEGFLARAPADAEHRPIAEQELRELRTRATLEAEGQIHPVGPIIAAVGGAALLAGSITGGLALAANDAADEGCIEGSCPAEYRDRAVEATTLANLTDGLLFGGLAVAAAGVLMIFLVPPDGAGDASVAASCSPFGCAGSVRGRF